MSSKFKVITFTIIIILFSSENIEADRVAKFRGGCSRFSSKSFSNFTLFTKNDGIYVDMFVITPLKPGFKANLEFQIRLSNSKDYQTLFAYTLDVCNLVISFKDTLFKKWFQSLLKYGNFMQNCPVNEGHYYLNGWKLDSSLVPSYLYPGDYRIKGYGFTGRYKTKSEKFILEIEVEFLVQEV